MKHADTRDVPQQAVGPGGSFLHAAGDVDAMGKLSLSTRLRKAVENQSWMLHYQPLIDLSTGGMIGVEALDPLARAGRRPDPARRVHPARRGDGADRGDRRLGGRGGLSAGRAVARARALALEICFNLSPRQLWQPDVVDKIVSRVTRRGWIRRASRSRSPSRRR